MKYTLILLSAIITAVLFANLHANYDQQADTTRKAKVLTGNQLYTKYCMTCHQADGRGVRGMFPPLSGNEKVTGASDEIIRIVLFGMEGPIVVNGRDYNQPMPPQGYLSDKQIADILTYVRSSWDNKASAVSPAEVLKARKLGKLKTN
jgi:mono/diheme cytochrome c family protein